MGCPGPQQRADGKETDRITSERRLRQRKSQSVREMPGRAGGERVLLVRTAREKTSARASVGGKNFGGRFGSRENANPM